MKAESADYVIFLKGKKEIRINNESFEIISKFLCSENPPQFFKVSGVIVNRNEISWMGPGRPSPDKYAFVDEAVN